MYSLSFDGVNDYLTAADAADLSFGDGAGTDLPFTVECWIKAPSYAGTYQQIIGKGYGQEWVLVIYDIANTLCFLLEDTTVGGQHIGRTFNGMASYVNQWIHVAGTYDGSSASTGIKIYINGVQVDNGNNNYGTYVSTGDTTQLLRLGKWATGCFAYKGTEYRIWNVELAAADILNHARNPNNISCNNTAGASYASNCILHYKCDEGTGTSLADASAQAHTGTFKGTGEPAWSNDIPSLSGLFHNL